MGVLLLLVVPRVVALRADAHSDLCWGSGIWSDEGFYTYNARNGVLFGAETRDDFNNRTIAPLLDVIQHAVFTRFGVGLVSARAISVAFGLLSLVFFYDGLRRVFGRRVALTGLVLLGGEFTYLFYNRLALMESPAVCITCLTLWFWSRGGTLGLFGCGLAAMSLIAWKNNFLVLLPAPFLALAWGRASWKQLFVYAAGVGVALALYLVLWGIPHRAALVHMNNFYRREQLQPRSMTQALWMVRRGWLGSRSGMMQRLETRTPVLTTLALVGLVTVPLGRRTRRDKAGRQARRLATVRLLWIWLLTGLGLLSVLRYGPTRYYLIFYPPLAGLAALTLWRLPVLWRRMRLWRTARLSAFLVALGLFYQLGQFVLWNLGLRDSLLVVSLVAGGVLAYGAMVLLCRSQTPRTKLLVGVILSAFLAISYGQTLWYFTHLQYRTSEIAQQITRLTDPGSVILGDWTPNVCLDSNRRAIPILQGLANDSDPVTRFHATHILVGDMRYQQQYWRKTAPDVVKEENALQTFQLYDYAMTLYRVPKTASHSPGTD